ncbi:MAG TPA: c-type cytochrome domain-containing protein [Tepidisphaeraceae bacterium]|nr:c-type cytochrome domain-containing protein [Tepidisphaeraceae bacterium]
MLTSVGLAGCVVAAGHFAAARAAEKDDTPGKAVDFVKDIQPIFKESCVKCHKAPDARGPGRGPGGPGGAGAAGPGGAGGPGGPGRGPAGGFRLDDKAAAMKGGKHGVAIVAGKAEDSLLYKLLTGPAKAGDDEVSAMPKGRRGEEFKALPADQVKLIKQWIDEGANWPK